MSQVAGNAPNRQPLQPMAEQLIVGCRLEHLLRRSCLASWLLSIATKLWVSLSLV